MPVVTLHVLADATTPTQWGVLAVAVLATAFVLFRPKMRAKKDPLQRAPTANSLAQQRAVERQMQTLLVELSEMARQVTAGLDTRAAKLEELLRQADARIANLTALLSAPAPIATASTAPAAPPPPSPYEPDPRHAEVYALADGGRTPAEIGAQLGRPSGEIELILALRPKA